MTVLSPPVSPPTEPVDDTPITINRAVTRADRIFNAALASSSAVVLIILAAVVVFLSVKGWPALQKGGIRFITDKTWSPDSGHFGAGPLLVGSVAIAIIAVLIAGPISLAAALMINEYAPVRLRSILTGAIDMLATVPSIVYGFWGWPWSRTSRPPQPSGWSTTSASSRSCAPPPSASSCSPSSPAV